jgi:hypothetical protein
MRQDPLNMPFEVWCAKIAPKLKNTQKSLRKHSFFDIFFFNFENFRSLCLYGAILAQKLNSFICKKKFWFSDTPGTPGGLSIVEWMVFESIRPLCFLSEAVAASLCYFFEDWLMKLISKPPEPTRHHNSIKLWILLPLRADLLVTLQYEIPCTLMQTFPKIRSDSWSYTFSYIKYSILISQL